MVPGGVARQGIGHLNRDGRALTLVEDRGEVLPGMAGPGLEQRDGAVGRLGHHPGGKDPGTLALGPRGQGLGAGRGGEFQDAHGGVIVVEHRPLGRLLGERCKRRGEAGRRLRDHVPLGGRRQRDGQGLLQARDAMKRQAAAVLEQGDHGRGARIVLRRAHARRGRGGEHRPTQPTAQPLQRVDLRLQGRDPGDAHQERGLLALQIQLPVAARLGAGVSGLEGGVGDGDTRGPGIVLRPVAPVALGLGLARGRCRVPGVGARRGGAPCFAQDAGGGFARRPEDDALHPRE
jgi:hypothetical protein